MLLKKIKHVVGRTSWDRACTWIICGVLLCGESCSCNEKLSYGWLLITLLFYPIRAMIPGVNQIRYLGELSYAMLGVAVCISVSIIGKNVPNIIRRVLECMGSISLELYLTNIFLLQAVAIMLEKCNYWRGK